MRCSNVLCIALTSALLLIASGCASSQPSNIVSRDLTRILLIFSSAAPAPDNANLTALLAGACNCSPHFIRRYLNNGLIYQVTLADDQTFTSFSHTLLAKGYELGLQSVEQDLLQHQ